MIKSECNRDTELHHKGWITMTLGVGPPITSFPVNWWTAESQYRRAVHSIALAIGIDGQTFESTRHDSSMYSLESRKFSLKWEKNEDDLSLWKVEKLTLKYVAGAVTKMYTQDARKPSLTSQWFVPRSGWLTNIPSTNHFIFLGLNISARLSDPSILEFSSRS